LVNSRKENTQTAFVNINKVPASFAIKTKDPRDKNKIKRRIGNYK